jgi:hypothetical protein
MTVIAWDGKSVAVDKQGNFGELRQATTKFKKLPTGEVLLWGGTAENGIAMADWYARGADPKDFPPEQRTDSWSRLVVVAKDKVLHYEQMPIPQRIEDSFCAWGSGRDFALGALAMGADARKAVEVACRFCTSCGIGIDVIEL